jgi:hypothetical protein
MQQSSLLDSTNFWLVLGGVLATVSAVFLSPYIDKLGTAWPQSPFVGGLALLALAVVCVFRAVVLYAAHHHFEYHMRDVVPCLDPEAHRLTHVEATGAPSNKTLSILRQLRTELGDSQQKIKSASETNKFWPTARNKRLRDEIWQENRPRLLETRGIVTVYTSLDRAYAEVRRPNEVGSTRVSRRVNPEDNLDSARSEIAQAIRELDERIVSLDQELLGDVRRRLP